MKLRSLAILAVLGQLGLVVAKLIDAFAASWVWVLAPIWTGALAFVITYTAVRLKARK